MFSLTLEIGIFTLVYTLKTVFHFNLIGTLLCLSSAVIAFKFLVALLCDSIVSLTL